MNRNKKIGITILGLTAAWWWILRGVRAIKIAFDELRYVSNDSEQMTMAVDLLIKNPLIIGVLIKNIKGDLYIMNRKVAYLNYPVNQRIKAQSISSFTIQFTASFNDLGQAIWDNIMTGDIRTLAVRFDGVIEGEKISINIDKTFTWDEVFG